MTPFAFRPRMLGTVGMNSDTLFDSRPGLPPNKLVPRSIVENTMQAVGGEGISPPSNMLVKLLFL